jgi:hypothetical protein
LFKTAERSGARGMPVFGATVLEAGMPRYFFHTRIGADLVSDPDGQDLRDPDHAWATARTLALQLLQGAASDPELLRAVIEVQDGAGEIVLEYPLSEAVEAEAPSIPPGSVH